MLLTLVAMLLCSSVYLSDAAGLLDEAVAAPLVQRLDSSQTASWTGIPDDLSLLSASAASHTASSSPPPPPPLSVAVPGDLITDLERAGVIGDPLYETNFKSTIF